MNLRLFKNLTSIAGHINKLKPLIDVGLNLKEINLFKKNFIIWAL